MKPLLTSVCMYYCAALCSARSIGNISSLETGLSTSGHGLASINATSTLDTRMLGDTPDCENLGHRADEDPRWDSKTAGLGKCECRRRHVFLYCDATIPNDHILDETHMKLDRHRCGRSVYEAVSRGWSAKSGFRCEIDHDNVAHLSWRNGVGTGIKHIQEGYDEGTCGVFKNVKCVKK